MKLNDISSLRIINQQIDQSKFNSVKLLVGHMGAMQAQDFLMAKYAIGLRVNNADDSIVSEAINNGDIIRTHLLRPTWHFVSSDNIYWMLKLTAPRIKKILNFRNKQLGLDTALYKKSNKIIEKALTGNNNLTREELISILKKNKIDVDENRASHYLMEAEIIELVCSGTIKNGKQTYALLDERITRKDNLSREEALAKLAELYFTSHGPATDKDFYWWSGLTIKEVRIAIELISKKFNVEKINEENYIFKNPSKFMKNSGVYLLPAYDEFVISYKDRTALLHPDNHESVISMNGIFKPTILVNGKVAGIWKRVTKNNVIKVEINLFGKVNSLNKNLIEKAVSKYSNFLGKEANIVM
ncbi:MAG TPA: winged helix DNA-binding domain-containing protein [Ignavibacteriaceae bacterium]|nr:winged helix DNA-binding domain-containing protein [Ignavibacteriaceae bacterium]